VSEGGSINDEEANDIAEEEDSMHQKHLSVMPVRPSFAQGSGHSLGSGLLRSGSQSSNPHQAIKYRNTTKVPVRAV